VYFRVELTHRCGVHIAEDRRRREDWLWGRVALANLGPANRKVRALELHAPRTVSHEPYARLYKPEFVAITGHSFTFSGLERATVAGQTAWVAQCWACVYADDTHYMRWIRSLDKVPAWAVLLGDI
jgi:hypothetical protein